MFCNKCGAEIDINDKFCNSCGEKIENKDIGSIIFKKYDEGGKLAEVPSEA